MFKSLFSRILSIFICCREGSTVLRRTLSTNLNQVVAVVNGGTGTGGISGNGNQPIINPCLHTPMIKVKQNGDHDRLTKISPQSTNAQEEISLMSLKDLRSFDENVNHRLTESPKNIRRSKKMWSGLLHLVPIFRASTSPRPTRL